MYDNMNVQRRLMFVSPQLELASFQLSGAYNVKLLNVMNDEDIES
jgi:hypothetical protein